MVKIMLKKTESIKEALLKTSFINLLARILGYLKQVSIAILLGFSYQTDAFFMALSLIGVFMIFVDVFDSLGIPNLVSAKEKGEEEFKRLAGLLLTFTTILALAVLLFAIILYPFLSKVAIGFDQRALESLKISYFLLLPYLFSSFFPHHFGALLRSQRRFTPYFVGEFILSFFSFLITAFGLWLYSSFLVLSIAVSLANLLATIYMIYAGKEFIHFEFYLDKTAKLILKHFFYLTALYGVFHLFILVDRSFASLLGEKGVSALTYGSLLAFALRGVVKLEHMAITALSETRASLETINKFAKFSLLVSLPTALFLFIFAPLLVEIFFGYGKFTKMDADLTATALRYYSLSIFFLFLWNVLYRAFQVLNWLKPVFFVAIAGVFINALANYIFVVVYKLGVAGICLGTFLAYAVINSLSYYFLYTRAKNELGRG